MIHISCSMKLVFQICLGVLLLQHPSTARLYRRDAYVAKRYGDGMSSTGSWDNYQGIESYGWNNHVSPIDEACDICNSFASSQGTQGYGSPQHMGGHYRGSHDKNPSNRPVDPNYRGNGYDNLSPEWNQRYRPRDKHRPHEDEPGWVKLTAPASGGGWSRPPTGIGMMDRKDTYRPGMYPVKVSTNDKGYWDSHPPREIPWEGDRNQSNDTKYSGSRHQGHGGLSPYQPGAGGYTDDFKPWDQTTKGVSGWDGNGKGIYVASSTPGSASGSSYASGWSGDSQKTSTRRPQYSVTIQENPNYSRPGGGNSYISPSKPASGHIPSGPDQWDRPTSSRPLPISGYGSSSPSLDTSSWDRPTTSQPSSSYERPSSSWKPSGSSSWERPSGPNSWDRPSSSYNRPSSSFRPQSSYDKPSSSWDRPVTNSYDKHSSSWNRPDSWDRPVGPVRESTGYGSAGSSLDNAPLGPDNSYIPPGPAYSGVTTTSPASYHGDHHRFPSSNVNTKPGYETPIPTGTGYDTKRPCSRGGCSSGYDRPMMNIGGHGRPSGNRYGSSESNYGQSGHGNNGYGSTNGYGGSSGGHGSSNNYGGSSGGHGSSNNYGGSSGGHGSSNNYRGSSGGYGSSNSYGGSTIGAHGGNRGGGHSNENRENWSSGGYNSNRGGNSNSGNGNNWGTGAYNSNRGGSSNSDSGGSWGGGGYRGGGSNWDSNNDNNNYNSNRGSSSGWMNLNSNRGGSGPSSGYGYGGSSSRGSGGGSYGDNSSGYGDFSHRYNSDGYGSSNDNYGSSGHHNRGSMYGGGRNNQGGGYSSSSYDTDRYSGYGSSSDSDRYHSRPSYGSSRPGGYDRERPSLMSGGYDNSHPSYGSSSSMRPYEFDRVGHESDYSSSTYRPEDYSSSTASPMDGYSSSTRDPNYDGYGTSTPDAPFQPYDQSSSSRPFLDYDRDGSPYPSDRYDYSDGPPQHHKHTGLYKVPMYNGHSGVGASTEYGFPTKIASNPGNDRDTTTTTTTTPQPDSTNSTESSATGN